MPPYCAFICLLGCNTLNSVLGNGKLLSPMTHILTNEKRWNGYGFNAFDEYLHFEIKIFVILDDNHMFKEVSIIKLVKCKVT